jgi:hypothetical protein
MQFAALRNPSEKRKSILPLQINDDIFQIVPQDTQMIPPKPSALILEMHNAQ